MPNGFSSVTRSPRCSSSGRYVRQRHRRVAAEQLERDAVRRAVLGGREGEGEAARRHRPSRPARCRRARSLRRETAAIAGGESVAIAREQRGRRVLALGRDHRLVQPVGPVARRVGEAALDLGDVDLGVRLRLGAQEESDARQRLIVERDMEGFEPRVERRGQDRDEALAQFGAVAVARHEDEAGIEPPERIGPHEQPDARPLLQIADAERHRQEADPRRSGTIRRAGSSR